MVGVWANKLKLNQWWNTGTIPCIQIKEEMNTLPTESRYPYSQYSQAHGSNTRMGESRIILKMINTWAHPPRHPPHHAHTYEDCYYASDKLFYPWIPEGLPGTAYLAADAVADIKTLSSLTNRDWLVWQRFLVWFDLITSRHHRNHNKSTV